MWLAGCLPLIVYSMIQCVCVTLAPVCSCFRVTSLTQLINFKYHFMKLSGCFCLPLTVYTYDSSCRCHSGSCLLVLESYQFTETLCQISCLNLAGCFRLPFSFFMIQAVCVILATVCWWLRIYSLHTISFPNLIYSSWVFASGSHALFSWPSMSLPSRELFDGAWQLSFFTKHIIFKCHCMTLADCFVFAI